MGARGGERAPCGHDQCNLVGCKAARPCIGMGRPDGPWLHPNSFRITSHALEMSVWWPTRPELSRGWPPAPGLGLQPRPEQLKVSVLNAERVPLGKPKRALLDIGD
jgi:hypothetical protein|eukprot:CAMPEP_0174301378 /NCGR_PEP_ID=MMETSP0809-20121228/59015_1 /TAXON_ID=73025 ORGANISM="Eutreptiella gymnastica-like, Strain CCMP1594" /NCGR_SAMPLE_ID=MMETSP0809 /ASSEMBLY_ACC=CAM_ASM_000658 /LENGTH=105 /DNA_ID=CAMNT_0015407119 /DNA_START=44 /DNA_END=361 /DNA_ORIENTATION=-